MPAGMRGREGNMKKKLLGLVACVATLALSGALLAGCSGSGDKTGGDSADGKETLTVGFDQSYPPYGFVGDDGKFTGFDLDLAQAVCDKNGWELKLSAIDWDAKDALLAQGNINCIWNGFTMEGREDGYTFSDPYMLNEQVIVVKAGSDISDFAGLSGKTVMTQVDSAALDVLEGDQAEVAATFKGGAAQTIGDYNNAFMQLDSGMIDAVHRSVPDRREPRQVRAAVHPAVHRALCRGLQEGRHRAGPEGLRDPEAARRRRHRQAAVREVRQLRHQLRQLGARQVMPPLAPGKQLDSVSY